MIKVDIFSGFLGAGKTTLIRKLIGQGAYAGEKLVLIENEFGEIGVDGDFLADAGVQITEMNSGCICCSLVGDFSASLEQVKRQFQPDRILIEPSGVGKLSDVISAVEGLEDPDFRVNALVTVADANKCRMYMKNFGEFFNNQVASASTLVLSRTQGMSQEKLLACAELLREVNARATIVTTPWEELSARDLLSTMENQDTLTAQLAQLAATTCPVCGHEHHHDHEHEHGHHHEHGHEHHHDHEHEHHHDHDHEHEHHHDHDHHHHHDHNCGCDHDHHADEILDSWGVETPRSYTQEDLQQALAALEQEKSYGQVLRAKGVVPQTGGGWLHFDYVPGETSVRAGTAAVTGRLCVIGSELKEQALAKLFQIA